MTFEEWWDASTSSATPNTYKGWEDSCREAWNAGYTAFANELCDKCGKTRQHAGGGCIHCVTEWCKDKVREAQANAKPEVAIAEAYRCGAESRDVEVAGLNKRLEQLGEYGLNSRAEVGKLQAEVDAEERRFNDLLDDFDRVVKERDTLEGALRKIADLRSIGKIEPEVVAFYALTSIRKTNEP